MNVKVITTALNCLIGSVALTFVNDNQSLELATKASNWQPKQLSAVTGVRPSLCTSGTAHVYKNHRSMILKFG